MKIDMHCHVKEGSIDSRVGIEEYITILKEHGFQGMVITDHDTYNGYRYWKKNLKGKKHTDFVVLKGIEYDTRDAGHILVIMPEGVKMRLLGSPQWWSFGTGTSMRRKVHELHSCEEILPFT